MGVLPLIPLLYLSCTITASQTQHEARNVLREDVSSNVRYMRLLKCAHPQPLHLIGTTVALECSWRYKLPEHVLRFV
eukprot:1142589-Pelagomonas_calceolata.AAC.3